MRDPNRIDRVLAKVRTLWKQVPDWRLGQLLVNLTEVDEGLFYLEDDKLEERIEKWLKAINQKDIS